MLSAVSVAVVGYRVDIVFGVVFEALGMVGKIVKHDLNEGLQRPRQYSVSLGHFRLKIFQNLSSGPEGGPKYQKKMFPQDFAQPSMPSPVQPSTSFVYLVNGNPR